MLHVQAEKGLVLWAAKDKMWWKTKDQGESITYKNVNF